MLESKATYLEDIEKSKYYVVADLIKRLALEKCDNELIEIANAACKRMALESFRSTHVDDVIEAFALMQDKLSAENINELVKAACERISEGNFDRYNVNDVIDAFTLMQDKLSTKNINELVKAACERISKKNFPDF